MGNDADRYRRFLDGDDNGLREIIDIYYNGLTLYISGIVRDAAETEDIVQDTFVRLAVKKPRFSGKSTFKTWLYAIARNSAYNYPSATRRGSRSSPPTSASRSRTAPTSSAST